MKIVNVMNYVSSRGEIPKGKTLTQLADYQPLQKMLANLTIAGLNSAARQAMEFYDSNRGPDDVDIPLLPRHISPDIVDVQRVALHFAARKQLIEEKVRDARDAHIAKLRELQLLELGTSRASSPEQGAGQSPPVTK